MGPAVRDWQLYGAQFSKIFSWMYSRSKQGVTLRCMEISKTGSMLMVSDALK